MVDVNVEGAGRHQGRLMHAQGSTIVAGAPYENIVVSYILLGRFERLPQSLTGANPMGSARSWDYHMMGYDGAACN